MLAAASGAFALEVFAGSVVAAPLRGVIADFEARTGEKVELHLGGSGTMLAQMELTGRGDVYIAGSPDFMELAEKKGLVDLATEVRPAYLVPVICVPRGNPGKIEKLADLARPGVRLGMGRPDTVCVGLYGVEMLEGAGVGAKAKSNVAVFAESCEKVAQLVGFGLVDAVIGWEVFARWDPAHIKVVAPIPGEVKRIAYVAAAMTAKPREPAKARAFLDLLGSKMGRAHFTALGYSTDIEGARALAGEEAKVGGYYQLPPAWK